MSDGRQVRRMEGGDRPVLCFTTRKFGRVSESWLWRQVTEMQRFTPWVLTWQYVNREAFPLTGLSYREVGSRPWPEGNTLLGKWGGRLVRLGSRNFYSPIGQERLRLRALLEGMKPAVLLGQSGPVALQMLPVAKALEIPVVAHFHGRDLSSALGDYWYRLSLVSSVRKFDHIIVVNEEQKKLLLGLKVDGARISVIPCGAPIDEQGPSSGSKSSKVRFIGVSRLVEKKGVNYTLRAFRKVVERNPECELILVGSGPAKDELFALAAQLGVQEKVEFVGQVGNDKVKDYLMSSDVFVQHSIVAKDGNKEGSSVSVAEAAGCGLPVIATTGSGGMEELVGHGETGFLVGQRNVEDMADRMMELAVDAELRQSFGRAARIRMMERYNLRGQVAKLERVLLSRCKGPPSV